MIGERIPQPDLPLLMQEELPLTIPGTTLLPNSDWQLSAEIVEGAEVQEEAVGNEDPWQAYLDLEQIGESLMLRGRQTGDYFQPLGMGGKRKALNDFMIDAKIPQHIRDLLPLVVSPQHIVWVAGWRVDERAKITTGTSRVLHLRFLKA